MGATNPDPDTFSAPPIAFEGAEAVSEWTSRTFLYLGVDNRPGVGEWHRSAKYAYSGNHSWTFQDESANRYHDAATYDLHGPVVDLAEAMHPMLRFYYRGESDESSGDELWWGILNGDIEPFGSTDGPAPEWTPIIVDLSEHIGTRIELMFRFEADACGADTPSEPVCGDGTSEGYFVDNIEIYEK